MNIRKIKTIANRLKDREVDLAFIIPGPNLRYILGVNIETYERFCLLYLDTNNEDVGIIIPKLDELKIKDIGINYFAYSDSENPLEFLKRIVKDKVKKIAFEERMPIKYFLILNNIYGNFEYTTLDDIIYEIRMIKEEEEIDNIHRAVKIIEAALKECEEYLSEDMTENEIASILYKEILRKGGVPKEILVQVAEHSSIPHWRHSDKRIKRGDVIVLDVSATYKDYYGDLTRTYVFGTPSNNKFYEIYNIVKEAHDRAIESAKENELASGIDNVARKFISEKGYAKYFIHRTGHGLGLEVHEEPFIVENDNKKLNKGMVFTIEPGIYLPNQFGVRLESDVVIDYQGKTKVLDEYWPNPVIK